MRTVRVLVAGSVDGDETGSSIKFLRRVHAAGGVASVAIAENEEQASRYAASFDALILTGGGDINPVLYDEAKDISTNVENPLRDTSDRLLFEAFARESRKVLGVCRGCQAINVFLGGTLIQHLPAAIPNVLWHSRDLYGRHDIMIEQGSIIHDILQTDLARVNTSHHQAIGRPGDGVRITARAKDGVIECAERGNILMVQWHPEYMGTEHDAVFRWLVN